MNHLIDQKLAFELLDNHPESVIFYTPVYDKGDPINIIDFEIVYCNDKAAAMANVSREEFFGQRLSSFPAADEQTKKLMLKELITVFQTGKAIESNHYNAVLRKHLNTLRSKVDHGVITITRDKTAELQAQEEKSSQSSFLNSILDASINALFAMEAVRDDNNKIIDFKIVKINAAFTKVIGKTAEEVEGKTYFTVFPDAKESDIFKVNCRVVNTGLPERRETHYSGDGFNSWYDVSLAKWGRDGLVVTFTDITDRKLSEEHQEQHQELVQTMLNAAFHGKALLEPVYNNNAVVDFKIIAANPSTEKQIGIKPDEAIGKTMSAMLPGYKANGAFNLFIKSLETAKSKRVEHFYEDERFQGWFDIYVAPVNGRIVVSFVNITRQKEEALHIQRQKNLLDAILSHSPSGISVTEVIRDDTGNVIDGRTLRANEAAVRYIGIPKDIYLSKTAKEIDPGILDSQVFKMALHTSETGEPFHTQYFLEPSKRWLELSVARMDEDHLINVFTDITATKEVQLQIEQFADTLQRYINTSQSAMALLKPVLNESEEIIDFTFGITNTAWAAYAGQTPETIAGDLVSKWLPEYLNNGLFNQYRKTFETGETIREETHYAGDEVNAWLDVMSTKMEDGVLITITDFTGIKQLQLKLETYVEDLKKSNQSLEEFAYAASHDLQEPLRKIQVYSEKLKEKHFAQLDNSGHDILTRIENATVRMSQLIHDLLLYSRLTGQRKVDDIVDLNELITEIKTDLDTAIQEKHAKITVDKLPVITGDKSQLRQVFHNLLSNSLKYSKKDLPAQITIKYSVIAGPDINASIPADREFHLINITDNGIGFEQQYAEEIFKIFQRLHSRMEYPGTGVGLAMVQKGVQNHGGLIKAEGEPGKGASFKIFLPMN